MYYLSRTNRSEDKLESCPTSHRRSAQALRQALPVIVLLLVFGVLFGNLLSSHMLCQKAGGLYSGGSTWGDLAWHLSMVSNFAERGWVAVRENPIFPGTRLSYPFLPDLLSAWLVRSERSFRRSWFRARTAQAAFALAK